MLLLTQQDCGFCDDAKAILSRLAEEYPLDISTLDVNSPDGHELARQYRVIFPPGVIIDGQPFSYGRPSERKLRRELKARLSRASA